MAITRKELLKELLPGINELFKDAYANWFKRYGGNDTNEQGLPMTPLKTDDHKYTTEAKDLPIEACVNMWIIKYGSGAVPAMETAEQEPLMWEIGNRLWWANRLQHNKPEDTYEIID